MTPAAATSPPIAAAPERPRLRLLRYEPGADRSPPPVPPSARPVPQAVAHPAPVPRALRRHTERVLRHTLEVLDGRRPAAHLAGCLTPRSLRYVRAAADQRSRRPPARLTSVHVSRPVPTAIEVAAVYRRGPRTRALAARFEQVDPDGWRCVALRLL